MTYVARHSLSFFFHNEAVFVAEVALPSAAAVADCRCDIKRHGQLDRHTIQPVVKPVEQPAEQPAASCKQTFNRLSEWLFNRFDNRLYRVNGVSLLLYVCLDYILRGFGVLNFM